MLGADGMLVCGTLRPRDSYAPVVLKVFYSLNRGGVRTTCDAEPAGAVVDWNARRVLGALRALPSFSSRELDVADWVMANASRHDHSRVD